mmetsp:Transcript_1363/g.3787  ORF Transcript_1363/g.3787 Transcript_1363/m.3787 type:complete len:132 (-) Transcript_1363:1152-1547(-)
MYDSGRPCISRLSRRKTKNCEVLIITREREETDISTINMPYTKIDVFPKRFVLSICEYSIPRPFLLASKHSSSLEEARQVSSSALVDMGKHDLSLEPRISRIDSCPALCPSQTHHHSFLCYRARHHPASPS